MFWEGVGDDIIVVSLVEAYGAVVAYEFSTGLTEDLKHFLGMLGAVHDLLGWRDKAGCLLLNVIEASYLVVGQLFPDLVEFSAFVTHKLATITTETCCCGFFAFLTLRLLWFICLGQSSMNLEQVINVEGCLQS